MTFYEARYCETLKKRYQPGIEECLSFVLSA